MALVAFLRGVNVGGHRTFRPAVLAEQLREFGVVNVGAAGTFIVRRPGSRATFKAELLRRLPFDADVALCDARELLSLHAGNPFGLDAAPPGVVRFVSVLTKASRVRPSTPIAFPESGEWLLQIVGTRDRFVFGMYRRHMKAIGYLGRIDKMFGVPATTRNWNTIASIVRILKPAPATR
ncbi:MAG TPA: DUF1697 domain-containing protein, partial [Vicinamibacterales bacterium]|nr:DUF1697 domain-containing protein [Vicinamibacterales bacterium]